MISFMDVDKFILSKVSIHIPEGISVGIIGETGSGKTTFLKLLCGLLEPQSGQVYVAGKNPVKERSRLAKSMGVLFAQIPLLESEESVSSNLENRRLIYGMSLEEYGQQQEYLIRVLGLEDFMQEKVRSLSLGQRRRAELAAVFLTRPRLLLLDEPTIGLDQNGKEAFRRLVREREKQGLTTIVTSHDMWDISATCSRIAILHQGTIYAYGNEALLLKKYAPVDVMQVTLQSGIPNLEDLPLKSYSISGDVLRIVYNCAHVTAAEVLRTILSYCVIKEVSVHKPDLKDVIFAIKEGDSKHHGSFY